MKAQNNEHMVGSVVRLLKNAHNIAWLFLSTNLHVLNRA
jgi:hypothetical protein